MTQPHRLSPSGPFLESGVGGVSCAARATAATNVGAGGFVLTFTQATGAAFVESTPGGDWTFTPNTCLYTYTGAAGRRFLVQVFATLAPQGATPNGTEMHMAIDRSGDVIGQTVLTDFTEGHVFGTAETPDPTPTNLTSARLIEPVPGTTVRPCFGSDPNNEVPIMIERLTMVITEVGLGA